MAEVPMTTVGRIYKPALRCDAARREVVRLVLDELGIEDAEVEAREGGKKGLRVAVTLAGAARAHAEEVSHRLARYLFEGEVRIA